MELFKEMKVREIGEKDNELGKTLTKLLTPCHLSMQLLTYHQVVSTIMISDPFVNYLDEISLIVFLLAFKDR